MDPLRWMRRFLNAQGGGGLSLPKTNTAGGNCWDLARVLFMLSQHDPFTLRMACAGLLILGMLGAAKTTGSGACVLLSFLASGMGGVYTCVKPEDMALLRWYCELTGRTKSLIEVSPATGWRCNLLHYVLNRPGIIGSRTEQAVTMLMTIVEACERGSKSSGSSDSFFDRQVRKLIRAGTEISYRAYGTSSIDMLERIFKSLPRKHGQVQDIDWQQGAECYKAITKGDSASMTARERKDFDRHARFLLNEFIDYPPDTRGSVIASWDAVADSLLSGQVADLFDTTTNFVPEVSFDGAIIALNTPRNVYGDAGRLVQTAFTWAWMTAAEQRVITDTSPCAFYFSDEAHTLVYRELVQGFANTRSARVCPVLISQNLPAFYDAAGAGGRDWAENLVANLNTKVLHCNGDQVTNEKMSKMIADEMKTWMNFHGNSEQPGKGGGGGSEGIGRKVLESDFTMLMKGGPESNFMTEAIVFQSGGAFLANDGQPYLRTAFRQEIPGRRTGA